MTARLQYLVSADIAVKEVYGGHTNWLIIFLTCRDTVRERAYIPQNLLERYGQHLSVSICPTRTSSSAVAIQYLGFYSNWKIADAMKPKA